jgi:AcrR family transcriptional regulator
MTAPPGLRERKKQELRTTLSQVALGMMRDKGIDAVTPESVAEAVGVSARTFRNYFASRDEAIVGAVVRGVVAIPAAMAARPAGEPVWDVLAHVLPDAVSAAMGAREDVAVLLREARLNPALGAEQLSRFEPLQRQFTAVFAERLGVDPRHDLAPRLLAGVARTAMGASIEAWALGDGSVSLADLLRDCLAQQRAGIPAGRAVTATV